MTIDDRFSEYMSRFESPFEEQSQTQEELDFDGYMKFHRDAILDSIGKIESRIQIKIYWNDFIKCCDEEQKKQFIRNCLNTIIKRYNMPYLLQLIDIATMNEEDMKKSIKFIKFLCGDDKWVSYVSRSLDRLDPKYTLNSPQLKIFLDSDYDHFRNKIDSYKSCNELMRNYFRDCSASEGKVALFKLVSTDYTGILVGQYHGLKS